jgi:branched-chain amino acid transport system permease protein
MRVRLRESVLPLLVLALLAAAPFLGFGQGWAMTLLARAMILGMAAVSLSFIVGGAGLISLGHAAMLGFGAYAVVVLDDAGITEAAVVVPVAMGAAAGFDPYPYRLVAYGIAGGIAGLAGMMLANATEFVAPSYLAWQRSGDLLFMVILGGVGSLHGAVLGALAFVLVEEWLGHITEHWRLIFGPLLILAVLFLRGGLAGLPAQLLGTRSRG